MTVSGLDTSPELVQPRRASGPARSLSLDIIAEAVVEIGFSEASITAVAKQLGVVHGALYRYIGDRNGMMAAAVEKATSEFSWPELSGDWKAVLLDESAAWWEFCGKHPGFVGELASVGMSPSMRRRTLEVSLHLHSCGLSALDSIMALDLIMDTIHDIFNRSKQRERVIQQILQLPQEEAAGYLDGLPDGIIEVIINALIGDPWPWFVNKLELFIDGIEHRLSLAGTA